MTLEQACQFIEDHQRAVSGYMAVKYARECLRDTLTDIKDEGNGRTISIIPYEQYVRVLTREFIALLMQGYDPWDILEKEGIQKGGD